MDGIKNYLPRKVYAHTYIGGVEMLPGEIRWTRNGGFFSNLRGETRVAVTQDNTGRVTLSFMCGNNVVASANLSPEDSDLVGDALTEAKEERARVHAQTH